MKGIGVKSLPVGEATIQIPFVRLNVILDVEFSILRGESPSLLPNKDMIEGGLDITLQGGYIYVGDLQQPLTLDNYFYVYVWAADDIPYVL